MSSVPPTIAGFTAFLRDVVGISADVLPDDSIYIPMALQVAQAIVNPALRAVVVPAQPPTASNRTTIYVLCCYNLGADNIFNFAQDLPDAPNVQGSDPPMPFFQWSRKQWNVYGFVSGVIQSSGDEGTNQSMVVQEAAKNFTLANLQQLKTPWGRQYLAYAQSYGPSTWGMN